jgi:hypothetical protein
MKSTGAELGGEGFGSKKEVDRLIRDFDHIDSEYSKDKQKVPGPEGEGHNSNTEEQPIKRAAGGRVDARNINHNPSEAQKAAGNYAKDTVHIQGLEIAVENAKGSKRRGVSKSGKAWECTLPAHYGYVRRTEGADGDHVDVYVGPHIGSKKVFVVDQIDPGTKAFDEIKALIGFGNKQQAKTIYLKAFSDGSGEKRIGNLTEVSMDVFKAWLRHGDTTKPFTDFA